MTTNRVVIEVYGGCVTAVHNAGSDWVLLDWDNLLDGDCVRTWNSFDGITQAWIKAEYPEDYKQIQKRIAADAA